MSEKQKDQKPPKIHVGTKMTAGAASGLGRLQKAAIQKQKGKGK